MRPYHEEVNGADANHTRDDQETPTTNGLSAHPHQGPRHEYMVRIQC